MPERFQPILRIVCLVLSGLVLYQVSRVLRPRGDALAAFRPGKVELHAMSAAEPATSLPEEIQARVNKIKGSQILGQIVTPPPARPVLLGIAGNDVFIRAPNGQTGLVQTGEEFGGVKLLRVGTNRVVVEFEGKKIELVVFEGFGSESLLGKEQ